MDEIKTAEQIAWRLREIGDVAFLIDGKRVLFARYLPEPGRFEASSAAVRLIQGIYEREPAMARKIVRHRIFSTETPGEMCLGMVKVAAKRLTAPLVPRDHSLKLDLVFEDVGYERVPFSDALEAPARSDDHLAWMRWVLELVSRASRREQKYLSDRPVAAALVSPEGDLLEWAVNSNASNRTLHAEVNLVQRFSARTGMRLPEGARIYTTLKCCKMCAGMIWEAASDPAQLQVYYWEDDPGPNARLTVFSEESFERERASAHRPELKLIKVESHLEPGG